MEKVYSDRHGPEEYVTGTLYFEILYFKTSLTFGIVKSNYKDYARPNLQCEFVYVISYPI